MLAVAHYARDNIKSYILFCVLRSMGTIFVSTGCLVFTNIFTILHQLEIKVIMKNDNNDFYLITASVMKELNKACS